MFPAFVFYMNRFIWD